MTICIVLLNRLGDLLQLFPMLKGLREGGDDVTLVINEQYKPILQYVPGVRSLGSRDVDQEEFDLLVNYSAGQQAKDLFYKIKAKQKIGFPASIGSIESEQGKWMNYFLSVPYGRLDNQFSIYDMFSRIGGVNKIVNPPYIDCDEVPQVMNMDMRPKIGLVMGASEKNRVWGSYNFQRLISLIDKYVDCDFYLLGKGQEEEAEADKIKDRVNVYNVVGKTTLSELVQVVSHLDVVVGGDTGILHLACMADVPTVGMYLGPSYMWATGPYGEGHYAVQPKLPCSPCFYNNFCNEQHCRKIVSPEEIFALTMRQLELDYKTGPYIKNNVYVSKFNKEMNLVEYVPEDDYVIELNLHNIIAMLGRDVWYNTIRGDHMIIPMNENYRIDYNSRIFLEEAIQTFPLMSQCCSEGLEVIKRHSGDDKNVKAFLDTHNAIASVNRRIFNLSKKCQTTCLSLKFFEIGIDMVDGANISQMLDHYKYHYEFMKGFLEELYHRVLYFGRN
jgi:ADP-heptose:LPS heptosyltransferase